MTFEQYATEVTPSPHTIPTNPSSSPVPTEQSVDGVEYNYRFSVTGDATEDGTIKIYAPSGITEVTILAGDTQAEIQAKVDAAFRRGHRG